jgi:hypothetical protein
MLTLPPEKLTFIIQKAREFDELVPADEGELGSDMTDDESVEILFDTPENSTEEELYEAIQGLDIDERIDLLALTWLGRGDFTAKEWPEARRQARDSITRDEADYLIGTPLLADYLEEAASLLGISLTEFERKHL